MEAHARNIRISPQKLNVVADLVRGKDVKSALTMLKFVPKKGAEPLRKVIRSAQANAEHNAKVDPALLMVKSIVVTKGPAYRRVHFAARGRAKPIRKPTAHVFVRLASK